MSKIILFVFSLFVFSWSSAQAVNPDEILADPTLELRARDIGQNLRCLVCQNQSIDESDAGLAKDLRILVRERIVLGDSDQEVLNFVVNRYGDYVLLKPPFKPVTFILWAGPILIFLIILFAGFRMIRKQSRQALNDPLSEDETQQLEELIALNKGENT